jgi:serine phosphatase RsbU (regulator of sigma subunit)
VRKRALSGTILVLGGALLLYLLLFSVIETMRTLRWGRSGDLHSRVELPSQEGPWVFAEVDSLDFLSDPYPAQGDTLLVVGSSALDSLDAAGALEALTKPVPPGTPVSLTFRRDGVAVSSAAVARARAFGETFRLVFVQTLRFLIGFGYVLVGLWALVSRPDSGGVRALALFCFSMVSLMIAGVHLLPLAGVDPPFEIPGQAGIGWGLAVMAACFGAFWLNLQMLFPRPLPVVRRHPALMHLVAYVPLAGVLVLARFTGAFLGVRQVAVVSIQVAVGMVILARRRDRARVPLERRQLSLVYYGSGVGLSALFLLVVLGLVAPLRQALPVFAWVLITNLTFLALLVSPISFAYAFGRYRLLEVEGRLRRGTRYILVTGGLLLFFVAVLYGASHVLLHTLHVQSRTPTLGIALLLALAFAPVQRRVRSIVDRRFYPEHARMQTLLDEFLATTASMGDRAAFWERLEENLKAGLGIESVIPVRRAATDLRFELPTGDVVPIGIRGALVRELERSSGALMVDESIASGRVSLSEEEDRWVKRNRVVLLLALRVRSRLTGFLAVAWQEGREDVKPQTLRLLASLASQVAVVSDNLRLLEENYEKKRLEEELAVARRVQEGFLPKELPDTPGLEVAACCEFSLEVAGDYYDVMSLPDNRTLLAIGDVAGKGAGAAMVMANLRASLRTIAGASVGLKDVVARLNDVMCQDTQPDQFITLFVCVYNPHAKLLTYVNAGHNAPRLIRPDGEVVSLDVRGLVLGVLPQIQYRAGQVSLRSGDVLVAFTDGVSDAMNAADREFGEERLVKTVLPIREEALAFLIDSIQREVRKHTGSLSFADDFTLLAARILPT